MNLKGKIVLVTGADGFLGSHLVEELLKQKANVIAISMYNSFNSFGWLNYIKKNKNLKIILGDLRDPFFFKKKINKVDIIYNLAALISVPHSFNASYSYFANNVLGTLNLLEFAIEKKVKKFIQFSSSEVYGSAKKIPLYENDNLNPQSPYAASKIASDSAALSYFHSYSLPVIILRPFNTFGPRQSTRAVIPGIICQLLKTHNVVKLGNLSPTRDFNYISDTISACVASLKIKKYGETFNISSNSEISINNLVKYFEKIVGNKIKIKIEKERYRNKNAEVFRLLGSNKKIKKYSNWKPKYVGKKGFYLALEKTYYWYKKNLKKIQNVDDLFL